jgi:hypothetical protein
VYATGDPDGWDAEPSLAIVISAVSVIEALAVPVPMTCRSPSTKPAASAPPAKRRGHL